MSYKEEMLETLFRRKRMLEGALERAELDINQKISGHIEVCNIRNHYRYYYRDPNRNNGKKRYTNDIAYVKQIAQQDYARAFVSKGRKELQQINALIGIYQKTIADELFQKLHPGRRLLVDPFLIDDEKFAEIWRDKAEKQKQELLKKYPNTYPIQSPILTENQEIVRSKSEKIIADKMKLYEIPYIYEKPLLLAKTVKHPDFTVLNKRTRKEYYWEHMGLMDHPDYFKNAISKLIFYQQNGIWIGKNLIITYETQEYPFDVSMVNQMIHEYLI